VGAGFDRDCHGFSDVSNRLRRGDRRPIELGGFGKIFSAVPAQKLVLASLGPNTTGAYSAYATLALGSTLALFLQFPLRQ
jgi:hypothetical protein